ncbi:MAG: ribonuclease domain-containing protein [Pseudomonadota bacterium]
MGAWVRRLAVLLGLALLAGLGQAFWTGGQGKLEAAGIHALELPEQARSTLALIRQGGPYPYAKDGSVFQNREGRLPPRERGYYREYTVPTPGSRDRGARRIVAGGGTAEFWYTADHYRTFKRIRE